LYFAVISASDALVSVRRASVLLSMGHKRIEETMLYAHVADNHRREIPEGILAAGAGETDPDARIVRMLCARASGSEV
jgi:hypothetical protein